jgi:hypothetical protein
MADRRGAVPQSPEIWGWRCKRTGQEWIPQGSSIGWVTGSDLFVEPRASYHIAQTVAGTKRLPIGQQTLHHRLQVAFWRASIKAA